MHPTKLQRMCVLHVRHLLVCIRELIMLKLVQMENGASLHGCTSHSATIISPQTSRCLLNDRTLHVQTSVHATLHGTTPMRLAIAPLRLSRFPAAQSACGAELRIFEFTNILQLCIVAPISYSCALSPVLQMMHMRCAHSCSCC
jgi:hypothetical protein